MTEKGYMFVADIENNRLVMSVTLDWMHIGCYHIDASYHAFPLNLEQTDEHLKGDYKTREDAVKSCALATATLGYQYFAVQDGGQCRTVAGSNAPDRIRGAGVSKMCLDNKGNELSYDAYRTTTPGITADMDGRSVPVALDLTV